MTDDEDDFYRRQDRTRMLASVRAKSESGQRLTRQERVALAADDAYVAVRRIKAEANGNLGRAVEQVMMHMMGSRIAQLERLDALEDRLAALEGGKAEAVTEPRKKLRII